MDAPGGEMTTPEPDIEVSIVMPCLNEEESLGACIKMAHEGLEGAGAKGEIVIADNGSTDGSQEIARGLGARVVDVPAKGYGAALMGGFEAARGRFIVMGDADGSYDFSSLQPFLERLGKATGETINLGVASNGLVEQIAQVDSTFLIGGTNWIGMSVPLHCSALGKVLLAYGAAQLSGQLPGGQLERRTDKTVTSEAALRTELATVRTRGYAVTDEELEPGLIAVATPVRGYDGAVVAALSVSGPTTRMNRDGLPAMAGYCAEEAAALSAVLGYRQRGARQHRKAG